MAIIISEIGYPFLHNKDTGHFLGTNSTWVQHGRASFPCKGPLAETQVCVGPWPPAITG